MKENTLADLLTDKEEFVNQQMLTVKYQVLCELFDLSKPMIIILGISWIVYTFVLLNMILDNRKEINNVRQEIKQLQSK
jgi:hypothetical protein